MGATDQDAALAVVTATSVPIHDIGTAIYLSPDVTGWAAEWGWSNPFAFYFAGRGGMLGDVGARRGDVRPRVVRSDAVQPMFTEGVGVAGATGRLHAWPRRTGSGARSTTRTWRGSTRSWRSPRNWSTGSKAPPSRSSSGGGMRPGRIRRRDGRPSSCRSCASGGAAPSRRHHGRRPVATRGDPDQRGPEPGEVLRVVRALPGLRPHQGASTTRPRRSPTGSARRPRRRARRPKYSAFEAGVPRPAGRHPVGLLERLPRGGDEPGTG